MQRLQDMLHRLPGQGDQDGGTDTAGAETKEKADRQRELVHRLGVYTLKCKTRSMHLVPRKQVETCEGFVKSPDAALKLARIAMLQCVFDRSTRKFRIVCRRSDDDDRFW